MAAILLAEMGLTCVAAVILGFFLGRLKGARTLGLIALGFNTLVFLFTLPISFAVNSPEHPAILVLEIAIWAMVLVGAVGYFLSEMVGSLFVELGATPAALVCIYFTFVGSRVSEWIGALGLLAAVILVGTLGVRLFSTLILRGKGARALGVLWFGFCAACGIGYWVAGRLGLLLITLPTVLIFWGFLYFVSGLLLPIPDDERAKEEKHRRQAFRSLITFGLGTNYPYYVMDDWKTQEHKDKDRPDPRVPGNAFSQFLAGPGIVINDCCHVTVTSTGFRLRVLPPGLSFTEKYEEVYAVVDLRTQLRTCTIEAETKDGIVVSIFTFMPHRIGANGRSPKLERSFPYNAADVQKAVFYQTPIEHKWARDRETQMATEDVRKIPWDELVLIKGPAILKQIILNYTCNELHTPGDPRSAIANEFRKQIKAQMAPLGIETMGGGISDIKPPAAVVQQRIENWEAKWKRRIEIEISRALAEEIRQTAAVWTQTQLQMMDHLTRILDQDATIMTEEAIVLQLIDALTMVEPGEAEEPPALPASAIIEGMRRGR